MQTTRYHGCYRASFFYVRRGFKKYREVRHRIGVRILFSRVGNGVGKAVENVPIPFIYNARVSLGGNQICTFSYFSEPP